VLHPRRGGGPVRLGDAINVAGSAPIRWA